MNGLWTGGEVPEGPMDGMALPRITTLIQYLIYNSENHYLETAFLRRTICQLGPVVPFMSANTSVIPSHCKIEQQWQMGPVTKKCLNWVAPNIGQFTPFTC